MTHSTPKHNKRSFDFSSKTQNLSSYTDSFDFRQFCQKQQFKEQTIIQKSDTRKPVYNTQAWPFSTIGLIQSVFIKNGQTQQTKGTITMVGPRIGITAAHNVYSHKLGEARYSIVTLGLNGNFYTLKCHVKKPFIISPKFKSLTFYQRIEYDYAFIVLDTEDLGNQCGFLGMRTNFDPRNQIVGVFGYPRDKWVDDLGQTIVSLWGDVGTINILPSNSNLFVYDISTNLGQSGAALLFSKGYQSQVVGIHTNGGKNSNIGLRLTNEILEYAQKQLYYYHRISLY